MARARAGDLRGNHRQYNHCFSRSNKRKSGSTTTVSTTPSWNIITPEPPTTPDPGSGNLKNAPKPMNNVQNDPNAKRYEIVSFHKHYTE